MKAVHLVVACFLFTGVVRGQQPPQPAQDATPSSVFRTGVDLVALNVVVTDGQEKYVTGLTPQNFAVYEDGVLQDVSFFAARDVALDLAILLDTSASMTDKMPTVQQAAIGFASTLRPGDRLSVVDIKDKVSILHPLDGDQAGAVAAIRRTSARGGTALYNGVYLAMKEMVKQRRLNDDVRRQALVVLSDGDDTASLMTFDDVMDVAKQSGISIYTIALRSGSYRSRSVRTSYFSNAEFSMKSLAQETGARSFFPTNITELAGIYSSIAEELATQYAIGYTSKNPKRDGGYRRVVVRIADHPGARTRTRNGYQGARPERVAILQ